MKSETRKTVVSADGHDVTITWDDEGDPVVVIKTNPIWKGRLKRPKITVLLNDVLVHEKTDSTGFDEPDDYRWVLTKEEFDAVYAGMTDDDGQPDHAEIWEAVQTHSGRSIGDLENELNAKWRELKQQQNGTLPKDMDRHVELGDEINQLTYALAVFKSRQPKPAE